MFLFTAKQEVERQGEWFAAEIFFYCIVLNKVKYRRLNKIFINENSLDCSAVLDLFCFGPRVFFSKVLYSIFF